MMFNSKIQQIFHHAWSDYCSSYNPTSVQVKAAYSIMNCKSGKLGCNISICDDCGYTDFHNNSCRNRNCPGCQAVLKELWIDKRKSEVIDTPYFHVVFTIPSELNALVYSNQELLYSLLHRCSAETLLELSANKKYLGATPGIIQVLHTWGQELNFHPHIHCIVSGGGLTSDQKLKSCGNGFFLPAKVMAPLFRGKLLSYLDSYHKSGIMSFSSCEKLRNSYEWKKLKDKLYSKAWCPDIRETFNGFGNAIEYLGRYTHKIAISNTRILKVTSTQVTFTAKDYKNNAVTKEVTVSPKEFIRRFMMHVLPSGFQKIRYYGFLNNRSKQKNLRVIFTLQGHQKFKSLYQDLSMDELLKQLWNVNLHVCPECGCVGMQHAGRTYSMRI
jgi:hypothetical protein